MTDLAALLDLVLPGDGTFPPASAVGLADWLRGEPRFASAAEAVRAACAEASEAALRAAETADPESFGTFLAGAYSGYYSRSVVLAAVAATTGYRSGPPQPRGHALPPFDPAWLALPAARPPLWRDPEGGT
jgi:hypothetical protein